MAQKEVWEKEYYNPKLVTLSEEPRKDLKIFVKFLRKEQGDDFNNLKALDLGSGTGRNGNYLADLGFQVAGFELSKTAVELAKQRASEQGLFNTNYRVLNIGEKYPLEDNSIDLVIDVMSSNSLNEKEREIYLAETSRVLKTGGYFFFRGLCKDGDKHTKNLIKLNTGLEKDTYINKDMGLVERVFTESDFIELYSKYFSILRLEKKSNYAKMNNQSYKRNYWVAYMQK
ncbi:class I SAM-dependent methyltransferase [Candidatus Kaiserbacteria bacterium]|nr:class I SAM-dependent methyltransferase [Candidatus Kaiserbacteria bacterium]